MNKLINIIHGYWFYLTRNKKSKQLSDSRMAICADCIHKKGGFCGICGCFLRAKTSVFDEHCPILRWKGENDV